MNYETILLFYLISVQEDQPAAESEADSTIILNSDKKLGVYDLF